MHIEILVEDSSGERLLNVLVPKILGRHGEPHTWRIHSYKGVGRLPKNLASKPDPAKRILLERLPQLLRGYGKTTGIDAVVVVLDTDNHDCVNFLAELKSLAARCNPAPNVLFRLAIEEMEAWYLGDEKALIAAYPKARKDVLKKYVQDSVCNTWELLADAVSPDKSAGMKKAGWSMSGQLKHELAAKVGPLMDIENNESPSFRKLRDGLRQLISDEMLNTLKGTS